MWVNPNHPPPERPTPPAENGERLATFPRGDGSELRVNLSTYQGRPFVSLRVWERRPGLRVVAGEGQGVLGPGPRGGRAGRGPGGWPTAPEVTGSRPRAAPERP